MRLTAREESKWTLQSAVAGSIRLQHGYEGGGSIAEGTTFEDGWVFYSQTHPGHTNGQSITQGEVFAAPPGSEFCLVCHPAHHWITVFIPTSILFPTPRDWELASPVKRQILKPPKDVVRQFTYLASRFLELVESKPELVNSSAAIESFQNEQLAAARELFVRNRYATSRHNMRWCQQAKTALERALSDSSLSLSIPELAKMVGVPERTLRTAFYRYYGLSPSELLRIARLNRVRQLLLASTPEQTTVSRVAFDLGFWDLGRFAGNYRELYGELPSTTLRKPAQCMVRIPSILSPNR